MTSITTPLPRTMAADLSTRVGHRVRVAGWVHRRRRLKSVAFLIVRDRSGAAQVVAAPGTVDGCPEETVVAVTGLVVANPAAPNGVEVTEPTIEMLSGVAATPPADLFRPSLDVSLPTLLDHAPVLLRHPGRRAVIELAAAAVRGFRATLDGLGFTEIHTPKIVGSATESGANVFELDYFGRRAYLAQSPQFYKQVMVGVKERVYETGPVFRAEPHDTARHLAQYTSLDAELGFIADHADVMAVLRDTLAGMIGAVERASSGRGQPHPRLPDVPEKIPVVHFVDALAIAGADPGSPDLAPADERRLGAWAEDEYASEFLFVVGYPMAKRPFYTHPDPGRPGYSNSFDLLFRGVELVTGGQRLHRYDEYVAAIEARGEPLEAYAGYLQAFSHGMPPHGGFAIGLERFVARLTGAANIREVTTFPRDLHRLSP